MGEAFVCPRCGWPEGTGPVEKARYIMKEDPTKEIIRYSDDSWKIVDKK